MSRILVFALGLWCLMGWGLAARAGEDSVPYSFMTTMWDMDDGLPHNLPLAFAQDTRGRVWISTPEGMARFNGHEFLVFDRVDTNGLDLSGSTALLAEKDGSLLVGNLHGVFRYQHDQWALLDPRLRQTRAEYLYRGNDGVLRIVSGNQLLSLWPDGRLQTWSLGDAPVQVFAIAQLPDGSLLLGAETGLFRIQQGKLSRHPGAAELEGAAVFHLSQDDTGWLVSSERGVWRLDAAGTLHSTEWMTRHDRAMRSSDGSLWLGEHDGQVVYVGPGGNEYRLRLPGTRVRAMLVDRDGALWTGSTEGVIRISQVAARPLRGGTGFMQSVIEDASGTLWLGHSFGLRRLVGNERSDVLSSSVKSLALAADGNGVWVGTYRDGVARVDRDGQVLMRIPFVQERTTSMILALAQTADGTVWIGAAGQELQRWVNGELQTLGKARGLPLTHIQVIQPDAAGGIWVGASNGMGHIDAKGRIRYWAGHQSLPAGSVHDVLLDPDGTVWIASDRGLLRYRDNRFVAFGLEQGLPQERLFRILADGNHLWVSSTRGVFCLDRDDLALMAAGRLNLLPVDVLDQTDGMPGVQGNGGSWPAGWRTADGRLLFPMSDGVGVIHTQKLTHRNHQQVPVEIEHLLIDGVETNPGKRVSMSTDMRRLEVRFTGLAYQSPERVRYRYRLVGYDDVWYESGDTSRASFTNLPAGDYRFEVEAMLLPLNWEDRGRVGSQHLQITVDAPWWQHPMTFAVAIGSAIVFVYGLLWFRMIQYRRRQQRLDQLIQERTDELVEKNDALQAAGHEREQLLRKLEYQAMHDVLTKLPNRRAADTHLRQALERSLHSGQLLAVALMDLDYFKRVNDTYGHDAGDFVLAELGRLLRAQAVGNVFAARHGGEEFLMVIETGEEDRVRSCLDTLRSDLARTPILLPDGTALTCTLSIGLAFLRTDGITAEALLSNADIRLYEAKRSGRNRVVG